MYLVSDIHSGKIDRCAWGQNRESSLQKKCIRNVEERGQKGKWNPRNKWIHSQYNFSTHVLCHYVNCQHCFHGSRGGRKVGTLKAKASVTPLWRADFSTSCCCVTYKEVKSVGARGSEKATLLHAQWLRAQAKAGLQVPSQCHTHPCSVLQLLLCCSPPSTHALVLTFFHPQISGALLNWCCLSHPVRQELEMLD